METNHSTSLVLSGRPMQSDEELRAQLTSEGARTILDHCAKSPTWNGIKHGVAGTGMRSLDSCKRKSYFLKLSGGNFASFQGKMPNGSNHFSPHSGEFHLSKRGWPGAVR